jgi:hypothetical protein
MMNHDDEVGDCYDESCRGMIHDHDRGCDRDRVSQMNDDDHMMMVDDDHHDEDDENRLVIEHDRHDHDRENRRGCSRSRVLDYYC